MKINTNFISLRERNKFLRKKLSNENKLLDKLKEEHDICIAKWPDDKEIADVHYNTLINYYNNLDNEKKLLLLFTGSECLTQDELHSFGWGFQISNNLSKPCADPFIAHFAGARKLRHADKLRSFYNVKKHIDNSITVISPMTNGVKNTSVLASQLDSFVNPVDGMADKEWHKLGNINKINSIAAVLKNVETEYALVMDGNDTAIMRDIDDEFIHRFKSLGKDIVFNATDVNYPKVHIERIKDMLSRQPNHRHLNAGVLFGYADKLKELYSNAAIKAQELADENSLKSEQFILKHCFDNKTMHVDSYQQLFVIPNAWYKVEYLA